MKKEPLTPASTGTDFLIGGGEMGALIREKDWSKTPLGPLEKWPQSLRTALSILMDSGYPMYIAWGSSFTQLYNDAYRPILGSTKHPAALGQGTPECFAEIWDFIGPMFERVISAGDASTYIDQLLELDRNGYVEECYFTFSYSAIRDETGRPGGVFVTVIETTARVLGERRMRVLRELAEQPTQTKTAEEICQSTARILEKNPNDLPFALLYLLEKDGKQAKLAAAIGVERGAQASPHLIALDNDNAAWPFGEAMRSGNQLVDDLKGRFSSVSSVSTSDQAIVLPLARAGQEALAGFLVAGISPRLFLSDDYSGFIGLMAGHIATAIANSRAYEEEKKRAEALAELDRAKTAFFSNASHEFRTPLTLMLGPAEELLNEPELASAHRKQVEVFYRNGLRLLKLANTLLDFSRIEAGRVEAVYEPTDLSQFSAELASVFRSAIEKAGMRLLVDCPPLAQPVYVDRSLWEKIVFNLLSNAFKYTLEGEIRISLRAENGMAVFSVADTGIGIAEQELPNLFKRFHRVEGARGRTLEGTGIGLALAQELVRLHGGTVRVESQYGKGSVFSVTIPFGKAHLPAARIGGNQTGQSIALAANPFVEEALRWLPDAGASDGEALAIHDSAAHAIKSQAGRARIVWADDNADMRDYVRRLLGANYEVISVADGQEALQAAIERQPDLVLTDVMMPNLDGFGLLKALRENPRTSSIPVVMLSARAGEEARVEGLESGADDYIIKPFNARELLARINGILALAKVRREALRREAELLAETTNILESIHEAFVAVDADWRITYWNLQAEQIHKVRREDVLWKNLWEAFPEALGTIYDREYHRVMIERVPISFEAPYDPLRGWFEMNIYPLDNGGLAFYFREVTEKRTAAKALARSEHRYRSLIEASTSVVWSTDENGRMVKDNSSWQAFTGQTLEEGWDWGWLNAIHPDDQQRTAAIWREALASRSNYYTEFRLKRHDGVYRYVITRGVPVLDDEGQLIEWVGTCTDIDARKKSEALVAGQKQALELAVNGSPLGAVLEVLTHTIEAQSNKSVFASILLLDSDGIHLRHGAAPHLPDSYNHAIDGTVIGDSVGSCGTAAFRGKPVIVSDIANDPLWAKFRELALEHGLRSCWSTPILSTRGKVLGTFALYYPEVCAPAPQDRDIVELLAHTAAVVIEREWESRERIAATQSLQESEERYRQLVHGLPAALYTCDAQGRITLYNRAAIDLWGREPEIGKDIWCGSHKMHEMDGSPLSNEQCPMAVALREGRDLIAEGIIERPDGTRRHILAHPQPIRNNLGAVVGGINILIDITERKQAEMALKEADRRKDEFLATLAHELRNPLAPIRNGLQIMRLAKDNRESVEQALGMMERQLEQMVRLIDDLLDLSRISRGKVELRKEYVDLAVVLSNAIETSRPLIDQRGHTLTIELPSEQVLLDADVTRLAQVFANLLNNAAKYTDKRGQIWLTAEPAGNEVMVSVKDTGVGISDHLLPKVFEMFSQVDRSLEKSQGGLGIGLNIVKQLVDLHGGTVEARSRGYGHGSEFIVRLPVISSEAQARQKPADVRDQPAASAPYRILVADDNEDSVFTMAMMLKIMGNEVRTAQDGIEAVKVAEEFRPQMILLDIGMPRLNGYDACRRIREQPWGSDTVVVALTGWGQDEDKRRSREAGFNHHLVKPIEPLALEKLIASLRIGAA